MSIILTEKGMAVLKHNGKVMNESLKANEKALDEGKWYLSGKSEDGKPRKRSSYVQYLRGYIQALKDIADGKMLEAWKPTERPAAAPASVNLEALVSKAVEAALAKALGK